MRALKVAGCLALAVALLACSATAASLQSTVARRPTPTPAASAAALRGELTVFAAASLAATFEELGAILEAENPELDVSLSFAGSSALRVQLAQGARADVFAAADDITMRRAQADGTVAPEARVFARNHLVIVTPAANPAEIVSPVDLARPGVKLVIAREDVPVGGYAREALARLDGSGTYGPRFAERALANVVSEEANVKQIVAKVQLGEADAGVVYSSDVTPKVRPRLHVVEIPAPLNVVARYPVALTERPGNEVAAAAFVDLLLSSRGQEVLRRHGLVPEASFQTTGPEATGPEATR